MPYCTDLSWKGNTLRVTLLKDWTEFPWDFTVGPVRRGKWSLDPRFLIRDIIYAMTYPDGDGFDTLQEAKESIPRALRSLKRSGYGGLAWHGDWRRC